MKGKYFPSKKMMSMRKKLETSDDSVSQILMMTEFKSTTSVVLFALFLGGFGVDRFVTDDAGMGALKIGLWIVSVAINIAVPDFAFISWAISLFFLVEVFTASNRAKEFNYKKFNQIVGVNKNI